MTREDEILNAAVKVFAEKGYSGATTSEIAKEAGVAEGTIFRYFKTKKDLLDKATLKLLKIISKEIITEGLTKLLDENKDKDEKEILKAIIKDRLQVFIKYQNLIKVVFVEIQYHPDLRKFVIENFALNALNILEEYFKTCIDKGIFRNIEPRIVIRSIVGIIGMYVVQRQAAPDIITIEDEKQIDLMVDIILNGISTKGGTIHE